MAKCFLRLFGVRHARFEALYDAFFDRRLGITTTSVVEHHQLGGEEGSRQHATSYHAYAYNRIRLVYNAYRARFGDERRRHRFIDVGCGEGRLVFFWAWKGYQSAGFDFDATLVDRAKANQTTFAGNGSLVTFFRADARTWRLPPEPSIINLFNPFDATLLRAFVANNLQVIAETQSLLLYLHDHHASELSDLGLDMVYREPYLRVSFWRAAPP